MNAVPDGVATVVPYETDQTVGNWLTMYELEKERCFIGFIDRLLPKGSVELLDIGCGTGLHSFLWSQTGRAVTASDFSTKFRDYIRQHYAFPFVWMDVLRCTLTAKYDVCFCMAIATILLDEERRFQTFETLANLVREGGFLVLVTPSNLRVFGNGKVSRRNELHSLDERDLGKLRELGFAVKSIYYASCSPRFLWRYSILRWFGRLIEALGVWLKIGARKVVVCQRKGGAGTSRALVE